MPLPKTVSPPPPPSPHPLQWGGRRSRAKFDHIVDDLVDNCHEQWREGNDVHLDTLDVYLLECLEADYNIDFEDDSEVTAVSTLLQDVYRKCAIGEIEAARAVLRDLASHPAMQKGESAGGGGDDDDDGSESGDDSGSEGGGGGGGGGGAGGGAAAPSGPDADGWETVPAKSGGKKGKGGAAAPAVAAAAAAPAAAAAAAAAASPSPAPAPAPASDAPSKDAAPPA